MGHVTRLVAAGRVSLTSTSLTGHTVSSHFTPEHMLAASPHFAHVPTLHQNTCSLQVPTLHQIACSLQVLTTCLICELGLIAVDDSRAECRWTEWSDWSACIRGRCDVRHRNRTRQCRSFPCPGDSVDVENCLQQNCSSEYLPYSE